MANKNVRITLRYENGQYGEDQIEFPGDNLSISGKALKTLYEAYQQSQDNLEVISKKAALVGTVKGLEIKLTITLE
jgi:hypothetical protein